MKRTEPSGEGPNGPTSSRPTAARAPRRDRTPPSAGPTPPGRAVPYEPAVAEIAVGPGEPPEHIFRRLLGAYLGGAREFILTERPSLSPATREVVRSFCRRTRQPEILSDESGVLRLRDLAYDSPVPLPQRLGRMGRLVVEFHREAVHSWSEVSLGADGAWERRDDEIDREAWYVERLAALRLANGDSCAAHLATWTVARSLERIADHAVTIGDVGRRLAERPNGAAPTTALKQFHRQAMDHLEGVLAATDGGVANDLLDMGEALMASGRALSERLIPGVNGGAMAPATAAAVARIFESIGRTVAYGQDIAQVVLDRSISLGSGASAPAGRALVPAI